MSRTANGINLLTLLEIGTDEFQWLQAELQERREAAYMSRMASPGWFGARKNGPAAAARYGWRVDEDGSTGRLKLQTILGAAPPVPLGTRTGSQMPPQRFGGILPDGKIVEIEYADDVTLRDTDFDQVEVPDDGTWYTLVAVYETTVIEPGLINLVQNSPTITGTRTAFTRYSKNSLYPAAPGPTDNPVPTVIRIDAADSANGNEGNYTILTITDDGTMTVTPSPPGADESVRFRVKGRFFTPPELGEPQDAHRNARLVWELRGRVTNPPDDALIAYDCYRDTGTDPNVILIDRRMSNEHREMPNPGDPVATILMPEQGAADITGGAPFTTRKLNVDLIEGGLGSATCLEVDMAPAQGAPVSNILIYNAGNFGGLAVAYVAADGIHSAVMNASLFISLAAPVFTLTIAQASILGFSLEAMPAGTGGWTHIVAYSAGGKIRVARSDDNCATFTVDGVVWDPTTVAAADTATYPSVLVTSWGRIIIAAVYFDQSAGTQKICEIHSDDYGDTWETNSNSGNIIVSGSQNPRHLDLAQDGWGNIYGVYIEDNGAEDEVWWWSGSGPNNPTLDPDKVETANRGTKLYCFISGGIILGQPRAVAFQDGTMAFALSQVDGGAGADQSVLIGHVKEGELYRLESVAEVDNSDYAGPTRPPTALTVLNTGYAILATYDTDATAAGIIYAHRFVPVSVSGSPSWPGGR